MTVRNHKGSLRGISIYDIGKEVKKTDDKGRVNKNSPSIVSNVRPQKPELKEGYRIFGPNQLASLLVPRQELTANQTIAGFQRDITRPHIRRIGESLQRGDPMPALELAIYRNSLWIVDGQHRALGAIIANEKIPVLIRKLDADQMRKLFASQARARKVNPSTLILSSDNPYAEYVQEAVTSSNLDQSPWFDMVTHRTSSPTRLTPHQLFESITRYSANTVTSHIGGVVTAKEFQRDKADELSGLFKAFGSKKSNPLAFRPISIRAITYAAILIVRRGGSDSEDIHRWKSHMPSFPWSEYSHLRQSKDLAVQLIFHWNKRLHESNKIKIDM